MGGTIPRKQWHGPCYRCAKRQASVASQNWPKMPALNTFLSKISSNCKKIFCVNRQMKKKAFLGRSRSVRTCRLAGWEGRSGPPSKIPKYTSDWEKNLKNLHPKFIQTSSKKFSQQYVEGGDQHPRLGNDTWEKERMAPPHTCGPLLGRGLPGHPLARPLGVVGEQLHQGVVLRRLGGGGCGRRPGREAVAPESDESKWKVHRHS